MISAHNDSAHRYFKTRRGGEGVTIRCCYTESNKVAIVASPSAETKEKDFARMISAHNDSAHRYFKTRRGGEGVTIRCCYTESNKVAIVASPSAETKEKEAGHDRNLVPGTIKGDTRGCTRTGLVRSVCSLVGLLVG